MKNLNCTKNGRKFSKSLRNERTRVYHLHKCRKIFSKKKKQRKLNEKYKSKTLRGLLEIFPKNILKQFKVNLLVSLKNLCKAAFKKLQKKNAEKKCSTICFYFL